MQAGRREGGLRQVRVLRRAASTVKKSHARMPSAWARRNSDQLGPVFLGKDPRRGSEGRCCPGAGVWACLPGKDFHLVPKDEDLDLAVAPVVCLFQTCHRAAFARNLCRLVHPP
jgi:hypothetical protein